MNPLAKGLLLLLCVVSIVVFTWRNHKYFYQTPIDFLIFAQAGKNFEASGQLYQRSDDYEKSYHPSAAIFKFPPAYQLLVKPFRQIPAEYRHVVMRLSFTAMYVLSLLLVYCYFVREIAPATTERFYFGAGLLVTGMWFMPFFESIRWLLTEIPFLLIFFGSFLLLIRSGRWPQLTAGVLLAFATVTKIYPAFLCSYLLIRRQKTALIGAVLGGLAFMLTALFLFDDENLFYFNTILPVLLGEDVTEKWVNLNLEKFLFIIGVIPEVTGTLFNITRLVFVSAMLLLLWRYRDRIDSRPDLVFAFILTTMFFCFPNYWPQYQIFLIIPFACLLACYLGQHRHRLLPLLLLTTLTLFIPDLLWKTVLEHVAQRDLLDLEMMAKEAWHEGTGTVLLKYSPVSWLLYFGYEYRALVPVVYWCLLALELHRRQ